jgi:hypothetical protein
MKNYSLFAGLIFILFTGILFSCEKRTEESTELPECIESIIEDSILSMDLKTIRVQYVNQEAHYWLNTDFMHFDGGEFVIDASCDTTCILCGECFPPACNDNYNFEDWLIIWEK